MTWINGERPASAHAAAFTSQTAMNASTTFQIHPFDARGIGKRFRHAAIFGAIEALQPGEAMRFVNDHDPLPLLQQLRERYGDMLAVEYRQRGHGAVIIDFAVVGAAGSDGDCGCCGSCA
jgi:uncharacterized protein (DUF2249 family)